MTTVRKHLDEILFMSTERAKELKNMPDEDIDYSDIPPLGEAFFQGAKRVERTLVSRDDGSGIEDEGLIISQ
ncbi:MAG: hypothetical protein F6K10_22145 [Moorea sp. SIO2B7]|nr:hypothetical protein [Moorena sp. SIO2B7]